MNESVHSLYVGSCMDMTPCGMVSRPFAQSYGSSWSCGGKAYTFASMCAIIPLTRKNKLPTFEPYSYPLGRIGAPRPCPRHLRHLTKRGSSWLMQSTVCDIFSYSFNECDNLILLHIHPVLIWRIYCSTTTKFGPVAVFLKQMGCRSHTDVAIDLNRMIQGSWVNRCSSQGLLVIYGRAAYAGGQDSLLS